MRKGRERGRGEGEACRETEWDVLFGRNWNNDVSIVTAGDAMWLELGLKPNADESRRSGWSGWVVNRKESRAGNEVRSRVQNGVHPDVRSPRRRDANPRCRATTTRLCCGPTTREQGALPVFAQIDAASPSMPLTCILCKPFRCRPLRDLLRQIWNTLGVACRSHRGYYYCQGWPSFLWLPHVQNGTR